jgi:hypothetical protein
MGEPYKREVKKAGKDYNKELDRIVKDGSWGDSASSAARDYSLIQQDQRSAQAARDYLKNH